MNGSLPQDAEAPDSPPSRPITIALCGDVMTGRGIDQALPHPGNPLLHESCVHDAADYLRLVEEAHGPLPKPVDFKYVWGAALDAWNRASADVRIINLETSVTKSDDYWPGKDIHYRMNPANVGCLTAANVSACALANNHVLDWGYPGLADTLQTLENAGLKTAGAGRNRTEAEAPAVLDVAGQGRVVLFSYGSQSSGIPGAWGAADDRAGINLVDEASPEDVHRIRRAVARVKRERDVVVASIHWGGNWGYEIPPVQRQFARQLIDLAGVDVVYGHSSHHVRGIEIYRDRPILYGCGDFLDDYEGIPGYEEFRNDLGLIYFAIVEPRTGRLVRLTMAPMQVFRMSLRRPTNADVRRLRDVLDRESRRFGANVELTEEGLLTLRW